MHPSTWCCITNINNIHAYNVFSYSHMISNGLTCITWNFAGNVCMRPSLFRARAPRSSERTNRLSVCGVHSPTQYNRLKIQQQTTHRKPSGPFDNRAPVETLKNKIKHVERIVQMPWMKHKLRIDDLVDVLASSSTFAASGIIFKLRKEAFVTRVYSTSFASYTRIVFFFSEQFSEQILTLLILYLKRRTIRIKQMFSTPFGQMIFATI